MRRTVVINVVGLTESLIGEHTPHLLRFKQAGSFARITPAFPAVTCTAQSNYLTGEPPRVHGIVGNGWYDRDLAEVHFWKQSNHLVRSRKLWEELRQEMLLRHPSTADTASQSPGLPQPGFTCAKLFWWYNMHSNADYTITPRPMYPADGRKVFDIYTQPGDLRHEIQRELGPFPFPTFWGPLAGVDSPRGQADAASRWIAESAKWIEQRFRPTLNLVYLPHLDYNLQRHGPYSYPPAPSEPGSEGALAHESPDGSAAPAGSARLNPAILRDLATIDDRVGDLVDTFRGQGVQVVILSEYGLTNVNHPIHLNRLFREHDARWIAVRDELGLELLNPGASAVFAVADHQVAHIYLNRPELESRVRSLVEQATGATVLGSDGKAELGIDHPRAGDLVAIAPQGAWFTYYYWLEDAVAPDFARTVDIHRKPGYDPVELFTDPGRSRLGLKAAIAWRLLRQRLGLRTLMDLIPLDAALVKGSHGRRPSDERDWPVFMTEGRDMLPTGAVESPEVFWMLRRLILRNP